MMITIGYLMTGLERAGFAIKGFCAYIVQCSMNELWPARGRLLQGIDHEHT